MYYDLVKAGVLPMIAALFVETNGVYFGLDNIDPWDLARDAREYAGPWPVIAHPPCKRWGKYWHGSPSKPHQYKLGADAGCFAAALTHVRNYGGVLEHPAYSHAYNYFGLTIPDARNVFMLEINEKSQEKLQGAMGSSGGSLSEWTVADSYGGRACYVEQGHYGHMSRKPTWLYAVGIDFTKRLIGGRSPQVIDKVALDRYGYEKARRIGVMAMVGGKDKEVIRGRTPLGFRDALMWLCDEKVSTI